MSDPIQGQDMVATRGPFLVELDTETRNGQLDRAAAWLGNVIAAQTAFRKRLESTAPKIEEPNIRLYLTEMLETARRHERQASDLFAPIGREPLQGRGVAGTILSATRTALNASEGLAGGAAGNWREIRELLIANLDAMGAFAIAEQFGLALAVRELRDLAFQIQCEKSSDQLVLQELMLEMASKSILYHENV